MDKPLLGQQMAKPEKYPTFVEGRQQDDPNEAEEGSLYPFGN